MSREPEIKAIAENYCVGFLIVDRQRPTGSHSVGSGTLVDFKGVKGVLTAAHVADAIMALPEFGIMRFSRHKFQAMTCSSSEIDVVLLGGEHAGDPGPDIAFVRLPPRIVANLEATNVFFNPYVRGAALQAGAEAPKPSLRFVTGVVGEESKLLGHQGSEVKTEHTSIIGIGEISAYEPGLGGIDRFEFEVRHHDGFPPPRSYGGVSGGGIWQLNEGDGPLSKYLMGVAYRETAPDATGIRRIICQGTNAIYEVLYLAVLDMFAPADAAKHRAGKD